MKPTSPHRLVRTGSHRLALALVSLLATASAPAANIYWDGTTTDWTTIGSWSTAVGAATPDPALVPGSGDVANFSINTITNTAQTVNLNAAQSVLGMVFLASNTAPTNLLGGGTNQALTLGTSGITVNAAAGAVTIGSATDGQNVAITLGGAQTWTNNSANLFTVVNAVTNGTNTLTVAGTGNTVINGAIGAGAGGLTKSGTGILTLAGANTFSGAITVGGGTLQLGSNSALSGSNSAAVNITGQSTFDLNGYDATVGRIFFASSSSGQTQTLTTGVGTLTLTGAAGGNGNISQDVNSAGPKVINGNINLGGGARTINSQIGTWTVNASFSNGTLNQTGGTILYTSSGTNATKLTGGTYQMGNSSALGTGTLTFAGGGISSSDATARTISNTIVFGSGSLGNATNNGKITFTGPMSSGAGSLTLNSDAQFDGIISGSAGFYVGGSATLTITNTANSFTGGFGTSGTTNQTATLRFDPGSKLVGTAGTFPTLNLNTGTVDLNGTDQTVHGIYFGVANAGTTGTLMTGMGTLTLSGSTITNGLDISPDSGAAHNKMISGNLNLGGATRLISGGGGLLTLSANVSNGNADFKGGTNLLSGTNTYTNTTLTGGTVRVGAVSTGSVGAITNGPLGTGTLTFSGGAISSKDTTPYPLLNAVAFNGSASATIGDATNNGTLTFGGPVNLGITAHTLTINSPTQIDGTIAATSGSYTKAGPGILVLTNGSNAQTGGTTVTAGTLALSGAGVFGASSGNLTLGGGTVDLGGTTDRVVGALSITAAAGSGDTLRNGALKGSSYAASNTSGTAIVSAALLANGAVGFSLNGAGGTVVFSGPNTYTGTTLLSAGTLNLGIAETLGTSGPMGNTALASTISFGGGTLQYSAANQYDYSSRFTASGNNAYKIDTNGQSVSVASALQAAGTSGLTKSGAGTLTLTVPNTYTGATTITAGTLSVTTIGDGGVAGNLGQATSANTNWVIGSGTLQYTGATASSNRGFTLSSGTTATFDITSGTTNLTISGASAISTGGLTKTGAGTLTLSGQNVYTGATTVNAGILKAGVAGTAGGGAFGNNSAVTLLDASAVGLDITGFNTWIGSLAGGGASGGNVTLGTSMLTVGGNNTTTTYTGKLSGIGGSLAKTGSGMLTLSASNDFTGDLTLSAGTLSGATDANLGAANRLIFDGGTLQVTGTALTTYAAGFIGTHAVVLNPGKTVGLDINSAANTFTVSQVLNQGSGGLTKLGAGTLTLGASNTYTGATALSAGKITVGVLGTASDGALGTNSALTMAGTTLDLNNFNTWVGSLTGSGAITLGSATLTVGGDNSSPATFSGSINGSGGLTKIGSGTLTLSGTNGYTGATTLSAGTLSVSTLANLGSATNPLVFDGGSLQVAGAALTNFGSHPVTFNDSKSVIFDIAASNTFTVSQPLNQGSGGLTKLGLGTLVLTVTNPFSGQLTVQNGTLSVGNIDSSGPDPALGNGALPVILGGSGTTGTLQYTGGTASSNKRFTLATGGTGTFQVDTAATVLSLGNAIDGGGNLLKTGAGTLVLFNYSTYGGNTTLGVSGSGGYGGVLKLGVAGALPATTNLFIHADCNSAGQTTLNLNDLNQTVNNITLYANDGNGSAASPTSIAAITTGNGILTVNGSITLDSFNGGGGLISGRLDLGGGVRSVIGLNQSRWLTLSALVANGGLNVTSGNVYLSNTNSTFSGGLTVSGTGKVYVGGASSGSPGSPASGPLGTGSITFSGGGMSSDTATARTILNPISFTADATFCVPGYGGNGNLTFSATGSTSLGGATRTLSVNPGSVVQLDGALGNGGISSSGGGTLVLTNGSNAFTSALTVGNGTLKAGAPNVLSGQALTVGTGTAGDVETLDIQTYNQTIGTLSIGTQGTGSGSTQVASIIGSGGFLTLGGTLTSTSGNQNKGSLISANLDLGTANLTSSARIITGSNSGGSSRIFDLAITGSITGSGVGLNKQGASVLGLSGQNTYSGTTTLTLGTINLGSAETVGVSGPLGSPAGSIVFNGGILQYSASNQHDYSSRVSNAAGQKFNIDTNGQNVVWATGLVSTGGTLTKTGTGILELAGNNTYGGATLLSTGTLVLSGNNSGSVSAVTISASTVGQFNALNSIPGTGRSVTNSGTLVFGPSFGTGNISAGLSRITTGSAGLIAIDNNPSANFDLNAAGLTSASLGSLANVTYTGTLTPQGGVYRLGGGSGVLTMGSVNSLTGTNTTTINGNVVLAALNNNTGVTTINAGTTLTLGGGTAGLNGSVGGNITNNGSLILNNFDAQAFGGVVSGTGPLTKNGAGPFTFTALQTYTGTTTINAGILAIGINHALPVNRTLAIAGGALDLGSNNQYIGQFSGTGGSVTGSGLLTVNPTAAATFAGSIQGAANLAKIGIQTLTLTGASTTTGTVSVMGGGLTLSGGGTLAGATGSIAVNDSIMTLDNAGAANDNDRVSDGKVVSLEGGTLVYNGANSNASSETLGTVTAIAGLSSISATPGTGTASAVLTLTSLTRSAGALLALSGSNLGTSANPYGRIQVAGGSASLAGGLTPVGGVVPGVYGSAFTSFVGYTDATGFAALGTAGYAWQNPYSSGDLSAAPANANVTGLTSGNVKAGGQTINSLNCLSSSSSITFNSITPGTLTIASGMLAGGGDGAGIGANVGTTTVRGQLTSGLSTGELFYMKGDGGSGGGNAGDSNIHSVIVDNGNPLSGGTRVKLVVISGTAPDQQGMNPSISAPNSYTGGTSVTASGSGRYSGTYGAYFNLNATTSGIVTVPAAADPNNGLVINNNGNVRELNFGGQIAPSNIVTLNGGACLTLTGSNTLAGLVFNSNGGKNTPLVTPTGTLTITGNISSTPSNMAVTPTIGAGTLDLNATTHNITVSALPEGNYASGPLNGLAISSVIQNGGFTKKGDGVLNLTGTNTFSGDLTVQQGVVNVATINETSASGPLGKSTNAVVLGGSGGKTGAIEYSGGSSTSTRLFTLATGGTGGFQVDAAATTLTLSGQIDGSGGLVKTGAGTLTLSSAKTYGGNTTVNAGTLKLDGAGSFANSPNIIVGDTAGSAAVLDVSNKTGGFTVGGTQTLGGCGVINGAVNVSGVLAPGASIETLASGALTLNNLATFAYEVNSSVAATVGADLLKAGGALSLNGTVTLSLTDIAALPITFDTGTTFSLINYTGAWNTGRFSYGSTILDDEAQFIAMNNTWKIDYNATSGGSNFSSEQVAGNFVNLTAMGGLVGSPKMVVLDPNQANIPNTGLQPFGTVAIGSSNSLTLTIKNTGNADLTLGSITLDGANPAEFTVTTAPTAPVGWAADSNTTTFTVKFTPGAAGDRYAILHIPNNDNNTFNISLSGSGINPYQNWIDGYPDIPVADRDPQDDPDHDGVTNLAEFAFNGVPNDPAKKGRFFTQLKDNGDGDTLKELTFTCAVRRSTSVAFPASGVQTATIDGVTYTIEANPVLTGTWSSAVSYAGKSNTPPAGSNLPDLTGTAWEYCIFSAFNGLGGKGFIRAKVTLP